MGDMVIGVHALERMLERWVSDTQDMTDEEIGVLIQGEVNDARINGRTSRLCPLEFANNNINNWSVRGDVWYSWNEDKTRGFVYKVEGEDVIVITTLIGVPTEQARKKLIRRHATRGKRMRHGTVRLHQPVISKADRKRAAKAEEQPENNRPGWIDEKTFQALKRFRRGL